MSLHLLQPVCVVVNCALFIYKYILPCLSLAEAVLKRSNRSLLGHIGLLQILLDGFIRHRGVSPVQNLRVCFLLLRSTFLVDEFCSVVTQVVICSELLQVSI